MWQILLLTTVLTGPDPVPAKQYEFSPKITTPAMALVIAAEDLGQLPEHERLYVRYTYVETPDTEVPSPKVGGFTYVLNSCVSHVQQLYTPVTLAGGRVIRWNLKALLETPAQLANYLLVEAKLATEDPYFHKPNLVRGSKDFNQLFLKLKVDPWVADNGREYDFKFIQISREEQFNLGLGESLPHLLTLHKATNSDLPITNLDWIQNIFNTTLKVGISSGVYYDLRLIPVKQENGQLVETPLRKLNQAQLLAAFGANEKDLDGKDADARAALFHSGVSNRARRIDVYLGSGINPTKAWPVIMVTHDTAATDVNDNQDPILNLLVFNDAAREAILMLPNGYLLWLLWDRNGVLQLVVPDQVAHDATVESPAPKTLVPGISCCCCHLPFKGYIPFNNDIKDLFEIVFNRSTVTAILADDGAKKNFKQQHLSDLLKVYNKYGGDLEPVMAITSALHSTAVKKSTGIDTKEIAAVLERSRDHYCNDALSNRDILYEHGYDIPPQGETPEEQTRAYAKAFNAIFPLPAGFEVVDDDGRIQPLRHELREMKISRAQANLIWAQLSVTDLNRRLELLKKETVQQEPALQNPAGKPVENTSPSTKQPNR